MNTKVSIRGHGGSIDLIVLRRENPGAQDPAETDWLRCRVDLTLGTYAAGTDISLTGDELVTFLDEVRTVHRALRGQASLEALERALTLRITLRPTGGQVQGALLVTESPRLQWEFEFSTDQTFLSEALPEMSALAEIYRTKGLA